jgi:adenylosuccinate lyase
MCGVARDALYVALDSTKVLMAAVRAGVGRETAHEAIKEHAVAVALAMRAGEAGNDLLDRLASDARLGLTREQLDALIAEPMEFTGAARDQVARVSQRIQLISEAHPTAAAYSPGAIL